MAKIEYQRRSPYNKTKFSEFYLDFYADREIPEDDSDILIELGEKYTNRPDLLAYDIYADTRLWWIFARRNMDTIKDPIFDFVGGIEIYVPTKDRVLQIIG
jgi:hypothetical protein